MEVFKVKLSLAKAISPVKENTLLEACPCSYSILWSFKTWSLQYFSSFMLLFILLETLVRREWNCFWKRQALETNFISKIISRKSNHLNI